MGEICKTRKFCPQKIQGYFFMELFRRDQEIMPLNSIRSFFSPLFPPFEKAGGREGARDNLCLFAIKINVNSQPVFTAYLFIIWSQLGLGTMVDSCQTFSVSVANGRICCRIKCPQICVVRDLWDLKGQQKCFKSIPYSSSSSSIAGRERGAFFLLFVTGIWMRAEQVSVCPAIIFFWATELQKMGILSRKGEIVCLCVSVWER